MDVDCEACGHPQTVPEADIARGPVEVTCARCGAFRLVTKSGKSIAPPKRRCEEPLDLGAIADFDFERLNDLASIAKQSEVGRAPVALAATELGARSAEEIVDVPPSVRATIRASLLPSPPVAEIAVAETAAAGPGDSVAPARPSRRGRFAVGIAGVAVVAVVAIAHLPISTEADGVERTATPFTPASHGPVSPSELLVGAMPSAPAAVGAANETAILKKDARSHDAIAEPGHRETATPTFRRAPLPKPAPSASVSASAQEAPTAAPAVTASNGASSTDLMRAIQNAVKAQP